jgi:hypothetical protein
MRNSQFAEVGVHVALDDDTAYLTATTANNNFYFETRSELNSFLTGYMEGRASVPEPVQIDRHPGWHEFDGFYNVVFA